MPEVSGLSNDESGLDFLQDGSLRLVNARSALPILLEVLRSQRIWMPSYLCPSLLQAVRQSDVQVLFHPINCHLQHSERAWMKNLREGDLVVLISYFGFPASEEVAAEIKRRKCWLLEDASQALFNHNRLSSADFILFSPRKFLGVPDGGILLTKCQVDLCAITPLKPNFWWLDNLEAMVLRREFDRHKMQNDWFQRYLKAKTAAPAGKYRMSEMTSSLLKSSFDYSKIVEQRINNYQILLKALESVALFPKLLPGVVPLGFPIRVAAREVITNALYAERIYPAVHWNLEGIIPKNFESSMELSRNIMTIPCDQRYGDEDMAEIVKIIRNYTHLN